MCLDLDKLTEKVRPAPPTELIGNIQGGTTLQPGAAAQEGPGSFHHYAEMPNTLKVTMGGVEKFKVGKSCCCSVKGVCGVEFCGLERKDISAATLGHVFTFADGGD